MLKRGLFLTFCQIVFWTGYAYSAGCQVVPRNDKLEVFCDQFGTDKIRNVKKDGLDYICEVQHERFDVVTTDAQGKEKTETVIIKELIDKIYQDSKVDPFWASVSGGMDKNEIKTLENYNIQNRGVKVADLLSNMFCHSFFSDKIALAFKSKAIDEYQDIEGLVVPIFYYAGKQGILNIYLYNPKDKEVLIFKGKETDLSKP